MSNPVPRFWRQNGNGKNLDGQRSKSEVFFAPCAKKYYLPLERLGGWNEHRMGIVFSGEACYT